MSEPATLGILNGWLLNLFESTLRAANGGRVTLSDVQRSALETAKERLRSDLRGAEHEQLLADFLSQAALKTCKLEAPGG